MSAAVAAEKQNRPADVEDGLPSPLPPLNRNDSADVSPKTQAPGDVPMPRTEEYFPETTTPPQGQRAPTATATTDTGVTITAQKADRPRIRIKGQESSLRDEKTLSRQSSTRSTATITRPTIEMLKDQHRPSFDSGVTIGRGRTASISSLSFAMSSDPKLPRGTHKKTDKVRIRASSPPPKRFQNHVAFDNLPLGDATKSNTPSFTLNVRHSGYQAKRRSRTFMVGVDEHAYSDYALQWLLDELVDDGDEVVCVRVIEREPRAFEKEKDNKDASKVYKDDAQKLMDAIIEKNGANRAISVILEYAAGKLHSTFQKLIQIYQPAMLIVGTRGRSLGGLQGLVNTRNSFSKYCLQYSPIPVVVVRPTEKREKKKSKRMNDTERQTYVRMLSATGGKHEADSERSSMYEVEVQYSADEEAHQVAKVLGLPASFDPTIKPLNTSTLMRPRTIEPSPLSTQTSRESDESKSSVAPASTAGDSEESDTSEDEFEVMTGDQALDQDAQERLHDMEVGEAAALLQQNRRESVDSGDEEAGKHSRKNSGG